MERGRGEMGRSRGALRRGRFLKEDGRMEVIAKRGKRGKRGREH